MDAEVPDLDCPGCRRLQAKVEALEAQIARLQRVIEELQRASKRQAAPFRKKNKPKRDSKKPGRKSGDDHGPHQHREAPQKIDEVHEAPLPERCPHCGGRHLGETHVDQQYQTDILCTPLHRQFNVHVGQCTGCGRAVRGRHALQTSDAIGAAAAQLGPTAHAMMAMLNKKYGLSHGKIWQLFGEVFGIQTTRSTSCRSVLRTARRCEPAYQQIAQDIRGSPWLVPDETGWRLGGRSAWLHVFVGARSTYYEIGDRSGDIATRLLGADWSGTLIHDGWSVYDGFQRAFHQQCLQHLQRRCEGLLETARGMAARLPRAVLGLIDEAYALRRAWRARRGTADEQAEAGLLLGCRLESVASGRFAHAPNRRLAQHILQHGLQWFWFLIDPTIDATNWRAEQAIRPAVVNRKVWGGNRTPPGARAQSILSSVLATLRQRAHSALTWLSSTLCHPTPLLLPRPAR
jgi:transposase